MKRLKRAEKSYVLNLEQLLPLEETDPAADDESTHPPHGECSICLDDLSGGQVIARLPCLCVYHKSCIDAWWRVSRTCPEHPDPD